jgi:predicted transcriptional regulator
MTEDQYQEFIEFTQNIYADRDAYSRGKIIEMLRDKVTEIKQLELTAVVQAKPEKVCDHQKTFKVVGGDVYLCPDCGKQFKNF